jgi:hypothetical protein
MKDYAIFIDATIDESWPNSDPTFQIAICPFSRSASAMATKEYERREALATELRTYLEYQTRMNEMVAGGNPGTVTSFRKQCAGCRCAAECP